MKALTFLWNWFPIICIPIGIVLIVSGLKIAGGIVLLAVMYNLARRGSTEKESLVEPTIEKGRAQRLKWALKSYFDGVSAMGDTLMDRVETSDLTTEKLHITNLEVYGRAGTDDVVLKITLERPGILIGRAGSRIDAVGEYIRKQCDEPHLVIRIEESNIWN